MHSSWRRWVEVTVSWGMNNESSLHAAHAVWPSSLEALESQGMDMEIDLSNLGIVNMMFAALFSKLGVLIKTKISATVIEDALGGTVTDLLLLDQQLVER